MNEQQRKHAGSFLGSWVATNVHPAGHNADGDPDRPRALASACVALAEVQNITRGDLEDLVGDLDAHMRRAQTIARKAAEAMDGADGLRPA